ncbi:Exocyst complex component 8 [Strongyloides ratti]|uniref:Exocyst complex component 8 n=1 Tax=Strongyloides ratti TaxID=34506 RepID=A0A090L8N6_STRRB|nr:Exocyst complex component 8 [Strongyloides ratti]CEF64498.1 Exocyst complex component 8 [Strongyloides ratti]
MDDDDIFTSENFNAANYISNQLRDINISQGTKKLQQFRQQLQTIDNESAEAIRKIVFSNYKEFIATSKEIAILERETYNLTNLLNEQKKLIENLMEHNDQDKMSTRSVSMNTLSGNQNSLVQVILQKMDGVARILNSQNESIKIILHGEGTLIDPDTHNQIHSIMLVLLTDKLLVGFPSHGGKYKYQLHASYQLSGLAAVNVKNRGEPENADASQKDRMFKLLVFPDQYYIMCNTVRLKKEWLEKIDSAKKEKLHESNLIRQNTIRGRRASTAELAARLENKMNERNGKLSLVPEDDSINLLDDDDQVWLSELPNELEVIIGQRNFEQAVEMILEWKNTKCRDPEINSQLQACERKLVQILSNDIRSGALHGGPKAVRKNINLLTSLGRKTQAVDLYLKRRSGILRGNARDLQVSEEPLSYVKKLCSLFITDIMSVANESFNQPQYALVLQWCSGELSLLLSLIRRHVIEVAPTMAVCAHTWRILINQCDKLVNIGLDLSFEINRLLIPSLKEALTSNFGNILESIKLRISEEKWKMYSLESDTNLNRFLEEMTDLEMSIDWSVSPTHPACINVTQNACHFAKSAYIVSRDFGLLDSPHIHKLGVNCILTLWKVFLNLLSSQNIPDNDTSKIVHKTTCQFIVSQVLPLCENIFSYQLPNGQGMLYLLVKNNYPSLISYLPELEIPRSDNESTIDYEDNFDCNNSDDVVDI